MKPKPVVQVPLTSTQRALVHRAINTEINLLKRLYGDIDWAVEQRAELRRVIDRLYDV